MNKKSTWLVWFGGSYSWTLIPIWLFLSLLSHLFISNVIVEEYAEIQAFIIQRLYHRFSEHAPPSSRFPHSQLQNVRSSDGLCKRSVTRFSYNNVFETLFTGYRFYTDAHKSKSASHRWCWRTVYWHQRTFICRVRRINGRWNACSTRNIFIPERIRS